MVYFYLTVVSLEPLEVLGGISTVNVRTNSQATVLKHVRLKQNKQITPGAEEMAQKTKYSRAWNYGRLFPGSLKIPKSIDSEVLYIKQCSVCT
jgi:hypothetical protein